MVPLGVHVSILAAFDGVRQWKNLARVGIQLLDVPQRRAPRLVHEGERARAWPHLERPTDARLDDLRRPRAKFDQLQRARVRRLSAKNLHREPIGRRSQA